MKYKQFLIIFISYMTNISQSIPAEAQFAYSQQSLMQIYLYNGRQYICCNNLVVSEQQTSYYPWVPTNRGVLTSLGNFMIFVKDLNDHFHKQTTQIRKWNSKCLIFEPFIAAYGYAGCQCLAELDDKLIYINESDELEVYDVFARSILRKIALPNNQVPQTIQQFADYIHIGVAGGNSYRLQTDFSLLPMPERKFSCLFLADGAVELQDGKRFLLSDGLPLISEQPLSFSSFGSFCGDSHLLSQLSENYFRYYENKFTNSKLIEELKLFKSYFKSDFALQTKNPPFVKQLFADLAQVLSVNCLQLSLLLSLKFPNKTPAPVLPPVYVPLQTKLIDLFSPEIFTGVALIGGFNLLMNQQIQVLAFGEYVLRIFTHQYSEAPVGESVSVNVGGKSEVFMVFSDSVGSNQLNYGQVYVLDQEIFKFIPTSSYCCLSRNCNLPISCIGVDNNQVLLLNEQKQLCAFDFDTKARKLVFSRFLLENGATADGIHHFVGIIYCSRFGKPVQVYDEGKLIELVGISGCYPWVQVGLIQVNEDNGRNFNYMRMFDSQLAESQNLLSFSTLGLAVSDSETETIIRRKYLETESKGSQQWAAECQAFLHYSLSMGFLQNYDKIQLFVDEIENSGTNRGKMLGADLRREYGLTVIIKRESQQQLNASSKKEQQLVNNVYGQTQKVQMEKTMKASGVNEGKNLVQSMTLSQNSTVVVDCDETQDLVDLNRSERKQISLKCPIKLSAPLVRLADIEQFCQANTLQKDSINFCDIVDDNCSFSFQQLRTVQGNEFTYKFTGLEIEKMVINNCFGFFDLSDCDIGELVLIRQAYQNVVVNENTQIEVFSAEKMRGQPSEGLSKIISNK